ncbi:unnamed protein product [Colias eurytheme]|nr:unnamed protein product [Colias eurytheme]
MNYDQSILPTIDLNRISKITLLQIDHVTCIECCKYYIVPTTAICGHTLCHTCWHGRQTCPVLSCGSKIDRKTLRLNLVLQNLTEHIHHLANAVQDLFKFKLDDYLHSGGELLNVNDPKKNVQDWLASSQNHFSAPVSSQNSLQEVNAAQKVIVTDIQVHTNSKKNPSPTNVIFVPVEQKDWDKIEELPDSEDILNKDKENIIGPMDIETYNFMPNDDNIAYSTDNPRRSSRKKDKECNSVKSSKLAKPNKNNKNWKNVRKMKKEFSKLNTLNKNKLNVSIEMCKKVKSNNLMNKITPQSNKKNVCNSNDDSGNDTIENDKKFEKSNSLMQTDDKIEININPTTELVKSLEKNTTDHENDKSRNKKNYAELLTRSVTEKETCKKPNVCFFKKNILIGTDIKNTIPVNVSENEKLETYDTEDIEITIKIGSTLTNICIKKKENDVQLKINSDREIQTSVDKQSNKISVSTSPIKGIYEKKSTQNDKCAQVISLNPNSKDGNIPVSQKLSQKSKKNTASADTASANIEITESIERELSTVMENVQETSENRSSIVSKANTLVKDHNTKDVVPNDDELNDLDMFDSESVKEGNVQSLKALGHVPSTILTSNFNKLRTQKNTTKRDRDAGDIDEPCSKKTKTKNSQLTQQKQATQKSHNDSELGNYDEIMSQVFANIDADMKNLHKSKDNANVSSAQQNISQTSINRRILQSQNKNVDKGQVTEKYSESIFTLMEKDIDDIDLKQPTQSKDETIIDKNKSNDDPKKLLEDHDMEIIELSTPQHKDDGSDESVVDETPQKNNSYTKKHADLIVNKDKALKLNQYGKSGASKNDKKLDESQGIVDITSFSGTVGDSTKNSRNITVVEQPKGGINFTPISINKFVDQIKHKSTPVSRKSLNFSESVDIDIDKTMCPSNFVAAKNTQEKEIMSKAFEQDDVMSQNIMANNRKNQKYYIAGSCLSLSEKTKVKQLCAQRNWVFMEKYTKELTHLIVSVDEEKKAQRSAKFMCALAASKWIVAYDWVEKCLQTNQIVDEEPYEALDITGEPGPKRSRLTKQKLFNGIKFFCMPPFGVLDVDTLKEILESAGGTVVNQAKAVEVTSSPALLLAEPESTQEDRFIYLAMELCIVPVNYEWVLNCLGSYTLCSIHELLLCPSSLLPPATSKWPTALITRENDSLIE